jgi:hypothetical protein
MGSHRTVHDEEPRSRKKRGVVLLALVTGLLTVVLVIIVVIAGTRDDPKTVTGKAAHEAGRNLRKVAGLALSGTYGGGPATFTVTRAGSARGTYTFSGDQVNRLDVGSTTYLKTGPDFWKAHGESSAIARTADGEWTKAPWGTVELGLGNMSPDELGRNLQEMEYGQVGQKTSLNGAKALKLTTAGLTYFLSESEPRRVLRVQGTVTNGAFSFDLAPVSSLDTFFTTLRNDVRALEDAYNPNVVILPTTGRPHYGACGLSGCTFTGNALPDASGGSGAIHLVTTILFKGSTGGIVVKCSNSTVTTPNLPVKYSCRTSGSKWTTWYRAHTGRFVVLAKPTFKATVNSAKDISALLALLTREQQTG